MPEQSEQVAVEKFYLCQTSQYWGRGASVDEARKQCRLAGAGGRDFKTYLVHEVEQPVGQQPPRITGFGDIEFARGGTCKVVEAKKDGKKLDPAKI